MSLQPSIVDIAIAAAGSIKVRGFKPNQPYEVCISYQWGNLEYLNIYPHLGPKSAHHSIRFENGEWVYGKNPLVFNQVSNYNWSHGCGGFSTWVKAETIEQLNEQVKAAAIGSTERYLKALESERDKYNESITKINNILNN